MSEIPSAAAPTLPALRALPPPAGLPVFGHGVAVELERLPRRLVARRAALGSSYRLRPGPRTS
jgi:hypothetical protein